MSAERSHLLDGVHLRTVRARTGAEGLRERVQAFAEESHEQARRAIEAYGVKQFAWLVEQSPVTVSHMLNRRGRNYLRHDYSAAIAAVAPDDGYASSLVAPGGLVASEPITLSPEQKLARLEQTLAEHLGPDLRAAIFARAYRTGGG